MHQAPGTYLTQRAALCDTEGTLCDTGKHLPDTRHTEGAPCALCVCAGASFLLLVQRARQPGQVPADLISVKSYFLVSPSTPSRHLLAGSKKVTRKNTVQMIFHQKTLADNVDSSAKWSSDCATCFVKSEFSQFSNQNHVFNFLHHYSHSAQSDQREKLIVFHLNDG